jgi:phosphatidate phosphatase PAH1
LFRKITQKDYIPKSRVAAEDVVVARKSQGYPIVYVSGRPHNLIEFGRQWLEEKNFPKGPIFHAARIEEILPNNNGVGNWKNSVLGWFNSVLGLKIAGAYGNAQTDIFAYNQTGIPKNKTWILGKHGGEQNTVALGETFEEHLKELTP